MPGESGIVTEQEAIEKYGNAAVMLIDSVNEGVGSGPITVGGSGNYQWTVTWDPNTGFSGQGWKVGVRDFSDSTEEEIREMADQIAFALAAQMHTCARFASVES